MRNGSIGNHLFLREVQLFPDSLTSRRCRAWQVVPVAVGHFTRESAEQPRVLRARWNLSSCLLPINQGAYIARSQMWKMGHHLSRELQMLLKFQCSLWHLSCMIFFYCQRIEN